MKVLRDFDVVRYDVRMSNPESVKSTAGEKEENKGVAFADGHEERKNKKKRYLTAKYDRKTRQKINEKIRIENFMFEELRKLYRTEVKQS